ETSDFPGTRLRHPAPLAGNFGFSRNALPAPPSPLAGEGAARSAAGEGASDQPQDTPSSVSAHAGRATFSREGRRGRERRILWLPVAQGIPPHPSRPLRAEPPSPARGEGGTERWILWLPVAQGIPPHPS